VAGAAGREESARGSRLDDRVLATLEGTGGRVAFGGLKRLLGAHSESLSRSLRRLERDHRVERVDGGYRRVGSDGAGTPPGPLRGRTIVEVDLAPGLSPAAVEARLSGHWFGELRWVGASDAGSERLLVWARRDAETTVVLGIGASTLRVMEGGRGRRSATRGSEAAAFELLHHAVAALRSSSADRGLSGAVLMARPSTPELRAAG